MFMHTITLYHHRIADNADVYDRTVLSGVYVSTGNTLSSSDKGVDVKGTTSVITDAKNAHAYGSKWTVCVGDRFIVGEGKDISSFKELNDAKSVSSVSVNVCGSDVDNIVITGV